MEDRGRYRVTFSPREVMNHYVCQPVGQLFTAGTQRKAVCRLLKLKLRSHLDRGDLMYVARFWIPTQRHKITPDTAAKAMSAPMAIISPSFSHTQQNANRAVLFDHPPTAPRRCFSRIGLLRQKTVSDHDGRGANDIR